MGLVCELCGGTDFVKDQGLFVCQKCGCKYTVDEARAVMEREAEKEREAKRSEAQARHHDPDARAKARTTSTPAKQPEPKLPPKPKPEPESQHAATIRVAADFSRVIGNGLQGAQAINNYACQGWQLLLDEYKRLEHPSKERQQELGDRAREVLVLLDNALRLDPENHLQNLLIIENCEEVVSSAHRTNYYEKDDEGKWRSRSFALDVKLPGQSRSWDELEKFHRGFVEQRYLDGHPEDVSEREALVAQREEIKGRLDELKQEKRSHGFFDFSGKREVKDRMKPVQDELNQVNRQINAIDGRVKDYVETRLKELESGYLRLDL